MHTYSSILCIIALLKVLLLEPLNEDYASILQFLASLFFKVMTCEWQEL